MRNKTYDEKQIQQAITSRLINKDTSWFAITYELVRKVALLKITDADSFANMKPSKQKSLLKQYFRLAAINLLKYRDTINKTGIRSKEGFVYIMLDTRNPRFIKIGKSIEPQRRLEEANCFSPERTFVISRWFFCEDAYYIENLVHKTFKQYNSSGEWFNISIEPVEQLIMTKIHAPLAKLDKARSF